jgi:DNA-directed RNA polymerase subunit RPC12/RpoP
MAGDKYECKRCGRPFQVKTKGKGSECVHCGSKEVVPQPERLPVVPSSWGPRGRFT